MLPALEQASRAPCLLTAPRCVESSSSQPGSVRTGRKGKEAPRWQRRSAWETPQVGQSLVEMDTCTEGWRPLLAGAQHNLQTSPPPPNSP